MRGSHTLLAVLCACGADDVWPADAAVPERELYEIAVGGGEPSDRPGPIYYAPVHVFVDGRVTRSLTSMREEELAGKHTFELRQAGKVLLSRTYDFEDGLCVRRIEQPGYPSTTRHTQIICSYWSGDLRLGVARRAAGSSCEFVCMPECGDHAPCAPGDRCTTRTTSIYPALGHLGCAPIGPKAAGDPCALIDSAGGAYDDCGENLICVGDKCQRTCDARYCEDHPGCRYVPGHPPELRICP
ncbi:MAG: hypothetical protein H0T46_04605 [Deltaproteobacteria bacterium]|nr:hypothetical protein [Deltaproteobacteria bacterium]